MKSFLPPIGTVSFPSNEPRLPCRSRRHRPRARLARVVLLLVAVSAGAGALVSPDGPAWAAALSEEEAVREALGHNPQVLAAEATLGARSAGVWQASSGFLPQASASFTRLKNDQQVLLDPSAFGPPTEIPGTPGDASASAPIVIRPEYSSSFTLDITQPLFAGGSIYQARRIAGAQARAARHDLEATRARVGLDAREAYYGIVASLGLARIARESVDQLRENKRVVDRMFEVGMIPRSDALRIDAGVAEAEQGLQRAEDGVGIARAALNAVLNREIATPVEVSEEIPLPEFSLTLEECRRRALNQRPDLKSLQASVESSERSVKATAGSLLPSVVLLYRYSWESTPGTFSAGEDSWFVAGTVSYSFPLGLGNLAAVQQSRRTARAVREGARTAHNGALVEVETHYAQFQAARKGLTLAERRLAAAEQAYREVSARYSAGDATQLDLLDVQTRLTEAKVNDLTTRIEYRLSLARLARVMGDPIVSAE